MDVGDETEGGEEGQDEGLPSPEIPRFVDWPCPAGWVQEAVATGDPWEFQICVPPTPEVQVCPEGEIRFVSEIHCERLGSPCPAA